jgi:signal peptidase I
MKFSKVGTSIVTGLLAAFVIALLGLWFAGFRFYVVSSPSMSTAAPVGTLVVTHAAEEYSTGDIVTYNRGDRSYTHRVIGTDIHDDYITKGDLNRAQDAAPVKASDIVGKAVFVGHYLGWVWRGLPLLLLGLLLIYLISCVKKWRDKWRWHIRIVGWPLVISIVTFIVNPWMHAELLTYTASKGGVDMHVVNTGVFPMKLDETIRIAPGEDAIVHVTDVDEFGRYKLVPKASIGWLGVALGMIWCLWPLFVGIFAKLPVTLTDEEYVEEEEENPKRRRRILALCGILLVVVTLLTFLQLRTYAALSASVQNTADRVSTRTYFTCAAAQSAASNPSPLFAYAVSSGTATETDISGHGLTGTWQATAPVSTGSASVGCQRDVRSIAAFNGMNTCLLNPVMYTNPQTYSIEAWFATTTKSGGKIIGFNSNSTNTGDVNYDRHLYIDKAGNLMFGVYQASVAKTMSSAATGRNYADGAWHHVVVTTSSAGSFMYLDGVLAASNASMNGAQIFNGYWKIGCGNVSNWRNADGTVNSPAPNYFTGRIQYAAVYGTPMSAAQVREHYLAGAP